MVATLRPLLAAEASAEAYAAGTDQSDLEQAVWLRLLERLESDGPSSIRKAGYAAPSARRCAAAAAPPVSSCRTAPNPPTTARPAPNSRR
uniref:Uncharacterized protein n=1 Tax=Streptomyces avermitilis TaxID=33903 RepID=A0A499VSE2_STRAX|nr:hypothetical protein SAVMC3_76970 [Streptomyces avermitilis]